jgi:hypothetical protein
MGWSSGLKPMSVIYQSLWISISSLVFVCGKKVSGGVSRISPYSSWSESLVRWNAMPKAVRPLWPQRFSRYLNRDCSHEICFEKSRACWRCRPTTPDFVYGKNSAKCSHHFSIYTAVLLPYPLALACPASCSSGRILNPGKVMRLVMLIGSWSVSGEKVRPSSLLQWWLIPDEKASQNKSSGITGRFSVSLSRRYHEF